MLAAQPVDFRKGMDSLPIPSSAISLSFTPSD
jgi:hypothetical protein